MPVPKLRPVEIFPVKGGQGVQFCLRDPEGIADGMFVMNRVTALLATMLDGEREIPAIQAEFAKRSNGVLVFRDVLEGLIGQLDERLLLFTERYEERKRKIVEEFLAKPARPAALAGAAYPADRDALRAHLDGYYVSQDGAGPKGAPLKGAAPVRGIVAPHIDFARGGTCYTHAYRPLAERCRADVFVILGVAHVSPPVPYTVLPKAYETPLGVAPPDEALISALRKRAPEECFTHGEAHRTEHSVEFQVIFLQHALERPFTVVPILCSAAEPICGSGSPRAAPRIEDFIGALRDAAKGDGREVAWVSGADLAHIGPRFGDPWDVTPERIQQMEFEDRRSLEAVRRCDPEAFWTSVMGDENARRVCGLSSIYTTLRMLEGEGVRGEVPKYGYAPDPAGGMVSFASAVF